MLCTDYLQMLRDVYQHAKETGHEILNADNPMRREIGLVCVDCGKEDPEGVLPSWEIGLIGLRTSLDTLPVRVSSLLRLAASSTAGRNQVLALINRNAKNPFFGPMELVNPMSNPYEVRVPDDQLPALGALLAGEPIPSTILCPACNKLHVDEGEFATRPHHTHRCVDDAAGNGCGHEWRLEELLVGVTSLSP
jgi:hypothetical protein